MAYRITTPSFLTGLVATILNSALPVIFKTSPHSKEYWDIIHALETETNKEVRFDLQWRLKELQKKEAQK